MHLQKLEGMDKLGYIQVLDKGPLDVDGPTGSDLALRVENKGTGQALGETHQFGDVV